MKILKIISQISKSYNKLVRKQENYMPANEINEALAQCGETLGNMLALKVADNKCPACNAIMHVETKPGIAIIYINKICLLCGHESQDFI